MFRADTVPQPFSALLHNVVIILPRFTWDFFRAGSDVTAVCRIFRRTDGRLCFCAHNVLQFLIVYVLA